MPGLYAEDASPTSNARQQSVVWAAFARAAPLPCEWLGRSQWQKTHTHEQQRAGGSWAPLVWGWRNDWPSQCSRFPGPLSAHNSIYLWPGQGVRSWSDYPVRTEERSFGSKRTKTSMYHRVVAAGTGPTGAPIVSAPRVSSEATFARCHATEQWAHWVPSYGTHRQYTEGRHPGAPSFRRTQGTGHTHAAWEDGVSPGATTAVPLLTPALYMAGQHTQSLARIGAPVKSDEQGITATHRHPPAS